MSKEDIYAQCYMTKALDNGAVATHVAWIPNQFAIEGKKIRISMNDVWVGGWVVVSVGAKRNGSYLVLKSRDHLRQRKASDV